MKSAIRLVNSKLLLAVSICLVTACSSGGGGGGNPSDGTGNRGIPDDAERIDPSAFDPASGLWMRQSNFLEEDGTKTSRLTLEVKEYDGILAETLCDEDRVVFDEEDSGEDEGLELYRVSDEHYFIVFNSEGVIVSQDFKRISDELAFESGAMSVTAGYIDVETDSGACAIREQQTLVNSDGDSEESVIYKLGIPYDDSKIMLAIDLDNGPLVAGEYTVYDDIYVSVYQGDYDEHYFGLPGLENPIMGFPLTNYPINQGTLFIDEVSDTRLTGSLQATDYNDNEIDVSFDVAFPSI